MAERLPNYIPVTEVPVVKDVLRLGGNVPVTISGEQEITLSFNPQNDLYELRHPQNVLIIPILFPFIKVHRDNVPGLQRYVRQFIAGVEPAAKDPTVTELFSLQNKQSEPSHN